MRSDRQLLGLTLVIVTGVALIASIACTGESTSPTSEKRAAADVEFQTFIRRYLDAPTTVGGPARIMVKDLPRDFDVPMPPEAILVGSIARDEGITQVVIDVPTKTPEETIGAFQVALEEAGWRLLTSGSTPGGVNSSELPESIILVACGDRDQWLQVRAANSPLLEEGTTDVRLTLAESGRFSTGCERPVTRNASAFSTGSPFPNLDPSPGTIEHDRFPLFYSGTAVTTANIFDTALAPESIAATYAQQLREAGWQNIESGVTHEAAWSHWRFTDRQGRGWIAVLTASQTSPDTELMTYPRTVVLEGIPLGHSLPPVPSLPR